MDRRITASDEYAIAAAQNAAQSGIRELLALHEAKVLTRMIAQYHSKEGISPENAKIGVAVIAELRSLAGSVNRTVERGTESARKLTSR